MGRPLTLDDLPIVRSVPALAAERVAALDRIASEELGLSVEVLMENAARQVAHAARLWLGGRVAGRRILVLGGRGNNGGDALGAARHLIGWGARVGCVVAAPPNELRPLARRQFETLAAMSARPASPPAPRAALDGVELVLDGLLGASSSGAPRGDVAALIGAANGCGAPVLAVDLPSGLDPDTGEAAAVAIRAALTVTLAVAKPGLLEPSAKSHVGELLLADIGMPAAAYARFGLDVSGLFVDGDLVRVPT